MRQRVSELRQANAKLMKDSLVEYKDPYSILAGKPIYPARKSHSVEQLDRVATQDMPLNYIDYRTKSNKAIR
jgi:hypothetical protein